MRFHPSGVPGLAEAEDMAVSEEWFGQQANRYGPVAEGSVERKWSLTSLSKRDFIIIVRATGLQSLSHMMSDF